MKLKDGFYEDGVQRVGAHKESQNLIYLLGRLKLGPKIPKIFLKNTFLMQNKKITAQLALHPLLGAYPPLLQNRSGNGIKDDI